MYMNLTSTPKIAPKGPKSAKEAPNMDVLKTKDGAVLQKNIRIRSSKFLKPDPEPMLSPIQSGVNPGFFGRSA